MGPTGKVKGWMDRHVMVVLHVESWLPKELEVPVLLAAGVSCRVLGSSSSMSSTNSSPSKSLNLSSLPSMKAHLDPSQAHSQQQHHHRYQYNTVARHPQSSGPFSCHLASYCVMYLYS